MVAAEVLVGLVVLVVGVAAGVVLGRTLARGHAAAELSAAYARLEAEREASSQRLEAERAAAADRLLAERTAAAERLEAERLAADQRVDDLRAGQADLESRLAALSQAALVQNSEQLLALAAERFGAQREAAERDLQARQQAIETLVTPLQQSLQRVQDQITQVERHRTDAYAALREQVTGMKETSELLRVETRQLVSALRAPQVRGRWGEHQLRRVVEVAGMVEHCDFSEQPTLTGSEGQSLRPDLVVHLAGDRHVAVDAKVSFAGYLDAMEARDDTVRAERLRAHARHLRTHIDALAGKQYWQHVEPSPDFVVMFVPAEVFLNAALEEDPGLLEHAFERNVVVATPATLVALLRTVAYSWRQEALAANAREVYALGKELHGRLSTMGGHVASLGKQLQGAVTAYNKTVSSLESRVLVQARRFTDLQVSDASLEPPAQIEIAPRALQAEELVAWDSQTLAVLDEDRRRAAG
jgi:DNA recombination protein RmuC